MLSQYMRLFTQKGSLPDGDNTTPPDAMVDVSLANQDGEGLLFDFNYLYVAQHYPFTNLFMLMGTLNSEDSKFKIEYWDGTSWQEAVDVLDGSKGLKRSGLIQFSRKNRYSWSEITETDDDTTGIPRQLRGLHINNCYWLRLSPITTGLYKAPDPLTKIKRICYAFTTTAHVNSVDVEGPSYYDSIDESGSKTDWLNEIIHASEEMVLDLKRAGFIRSAGQIIELDELYLPCAWKTLAHIYFQLGKAYEANRAIMNNKYEKALTSRALTFDKDQDAKLDKSEINSSESRMTR